MLLIITVTLGLLAGTPPVEDVHKAALEYAHIEMKDATEWKKHAKLSAILPRLQFDFAHRTRELVDVNVNENVYVGASDVVVGPEEGSYGESSDLYRTFGVRAVWSLSELIFTKNSLDVSRQTLAVVQNRNLILEAVNKHYFERKKLAEEISESPSGKEAKGIALKKLAFEKETAALDALTGGWFSSRSHSEK